jgi:integrase
MPIDAMNPQATRQLHPFLCGITLSTHKIHAALGPNRRALELVLEALTPDLCVSDYTLTEQKRIAAHLQKSGLSTGYTRRVMGIAAAALNWSWKNGEIDKQMPITLLPEGEGRQRIMTIQEMAQLWDADMPPHMQVFVALLIGTVSRPEALLQLTREQCDLTHGIIDLNPPGRERTKKRRPRVPMAHFLRPIIKAAEPGSLITSHGKPIAKINKT